MPALRAACLVLLLFALTVLLGPPPTARAQEKAGPPYNVNVESDLVCTDADGVDNRLDVYLPAGAPRPLPVVIALHGGSWLVGSRIEMMPMAQYLATRGYAVVTPDYRYAPIYHYPAQIEDTRAALRWVRDHADEQSFDLNRVVLAGASAGAQLAALVALTPASGEPPIRAVLDCYGPMDFTAPAPDEKSVLAVKLYLGPSREENPDLYKTSSPITYVTATSPPFFIAHGTKDDIVPYSQSERMVAALQAAGVKTTFLSIPNAGHNMVTQESPYRDRVLDACFAFLHEVCPP